ncbi:26210_t:CDS:2, partial [Gigaspora margarita]
WDIDFWDNFFFERSNASERSKRKSHHALADELKDLAKSLKSKTQECQKILALSRKLKQLKENLQPKKKSKLSEEVLDIEYNDIDKEQCQTKSERIILDYHELTSDSNNDLISEARNNNKIKLDLMDIQNELQYEPVNEESLLPLEILSSLHEASLNHFLAKNVFMENEQFKLYKAVAYCFNDLCDSIPKVVSLKMTKEEHCFTFFYPIVQPFFTSKKEYKLSLYYANLEKERPDLSCTINDIPILNSEIKPIGCTLLLQKKNHIKAQLKERRSINQ